VWNRIKDILKNAKRSKRDITQNKERRWVWNFDDVKLWIKIIIPNDNRGINHSEINYWLN